MEIHVSSMPPEKKLRSLAFQKATTRAFSVFLCSSGLCSTGDMFLEFGSGMQQL